MPSSWWCLCVHLYRGFGLWYSERKEEQFFCSLDFCWNKSYVFSPFCSRLLLHSGSIRCLSKRFSASSANLEGLWEAGWGLPIPLRGVVEKRTGDRDQGHFLLGFLAHLSWCGCFCVVEAYMYLLNWARGLASSKGHHRDVAVADAKGKGLSPRWATLFSSVAREGALSPPLNSAGLLASATR